MVLMPHAPPGLLDEGLEFHVSLGLCTYLERFNLTPWESRPG